MPPSSLDTDLESTMDRLRCALEGEQPYVVGGSDWDRERFPNVALALATSGSTSGTGRLVGLSAAALRASVAATYRRLGGAGQWLLTLPATHVAGVQVLVRSVLAGTTPLLADPGPFDPEALAGTITRMRADMPRYISLVPAQLVRCLASDSAMSALATCQAVLVGGARLAQPVLEKALAAGVKIVTTYGMTETCGGCIYDGVPLDGASAHLGQGGRIYLAGPMLAEGYLDDGDQPFEVHEGTRALRTADWGEFDAGKLVVRGRLDDVIISGGVNIVPAEVEDELAQLPGFGECCVVGVPDAQWGQLVTVVVVGTETAEADLGRVRAALGSKATTPRALVCVPSLPLRPSGKVDRQASARLASELLARGQGQRH